MGERIGILGGTFDPPHIGHLAVAYAALEELKLREVRLIPAAQQPLKAAGESSAPAHRLKMTQLLAELDARLVVDAAEVERAGLSFTIETVRALQRLHPGAAFTLLMGEDTAATLPQWREWQALAGLVQVAVAARGDARGALPAGFNARWLATRRIDLSASELRQRVRDGLPIRGFVPEAVASYIEKHQLYRTTESDSP